VRQTFASVSELLTMGIAGSSVTPIRLIVVLTSFSALVWITRRATHWFVESVLVRRGLDIGIGEALGAVIRYAVLALGTLVILQSAGINLTSLNVLLGAVGVGLGFGLQHVASNFVAGLIILFERPIKIGQRIEIGGAIGEVHEIAARATTIITDENVALIIPNSQFVTERLANWSRPTPLTAYTVAFHVAHTVDPLLVKRVLLAAAAAHPDIVSEPAAQVEFVEAGVAALRFQLQVWSKTHVKSGGHLKSDLNFEVWRQLSAEKVAISTAAVPMPFGGVILTPPS